MQAAFSYNLPCIPGRPIRLKIQQIPKKGFHSRSFRQKEDYSQMGDSFVQQYSNLSHPRRSVSCKEDSQNNDTVTKASSTHKSKAPESWYIIPQYKGALIGLLEESGVSETRVVPKRRENPSKNMYASFIRHKNHLSDQYEQKVREQHHKQWEDEKERRESKRTKPSPCFLSEPRSRGYLEREMKVEDEESEYEVITNDALQEQIPSMYQDDTDSRESRAADDLKGMQALKKETHNLLERVRSKRQPPTIPKQTIPQQSYSPPDHMFVMDDRDRFGNQMFPIAPKLNVPGPGTYKEKDTLENRTRKIKLLEEQRRILKQWFND